MKLKKNYININGESIFYLCGGEKTDEKILFVHGNMSSSSCFINLIESLDGFEVYALDMRGFGESSYNNKVQSIYDLVSDLKKFILDLDLNNFTLVSWSFGSVIALEISRDDLIKKRIKNEIFLAPVGYSPFNTNGADILTNNFQEYLSDFDFLNPEKNLEILNNFMHFNLSLIEESFKSMGINNKKSTIDIIKILFKTFIYNVNLPDKKEFDRNVLAASKQKNLEDIASILRNYEYFGNNLKINSIVLHGYDDKVISYMDGKFLAQKIGASFKKLDDCGHSVMTDKFDEALETIKKFAEE